MNTKRNLYLPDSSVIREQVSDPLMIEAEYRDVSPHHPTEI